MVWKNRNEPSSVYRDGKLSEILNCENPTGREVQECNSLICKKELFDTNQIHSGERSTTVSMTYGHSNRPNYSTHVVEVRTDEGNLFFECEMEDSRVSNVMQLTEEDLRERNLTKR